MQEETDKMVATIESMTGDFHSLKNKVHVLTSEVEEEEKKIKQVIVPKKKKKLLLEYGYNFSLLDFTQTAFECNKRNQLFETV